MTEESNEFPEIGEIDWSQMEHLANENGSLDDAPMPAFSQRILTEVMVNKRMVWDVSPHMAVERISTYLDLPVSSDEGMGMEHAEAHDRMENVRALGSPINLLARAASRAVYANMVVMGEHESIPLDGEVFVEQTDALEIVIFNSTLGIISELMDLGLLHTPHLITTEEFEAIKQASTGERQE